MKYINSIFISFLLTFVVYGDEKTVTGDSYTFSCRDRVETTVFEEDFYDFRWGLKPTNTILIVSVSPEWDSSIIDSFEKRYVKNRLKNEGIESVTPSRHKLDSTTFKGDYLEFMIVHKDGTTKWEHEFFFIYDNKEWEGTLTTSSKTDIKKAFQILETVRLNKNKPE